MHIHTWRKREIRIEDQHGILLGRITYKICTTCKKVIL
jgi:hypothetical protein